MTVIDPNDLGAIEKSVADAATQSRTTWLAFITYAAYLAVAIASITDLTLLLQSRMRLPVLNVDLPFIGFAVIAPMSVLVIHLYMVEIRGSCAQSRIILQFVIGKFRYFRRPTARIATAGLVSICTITDRSAQPWSDECEHLFY